MRSRRKVNKGTKKTKKEEKKKINERKNRIRDERVESEGKGDKQDETE